MQTSLQQSFRVRVEHNFLSIQGTIFFKYREGRLLQWEDQMLEEKKFMLQTTLPWPHPLQSMGTIWNPVLRKGRGGSINDVELERTIWTISSTFCHLVLSLPYLPVEIWISLVFCLFVWFGVFFGLFLCLVLFWCYILDQLFIKGQFCRYLWRLWKKKQALKSH